ELKPLRRLPFPQLPLVSRPPQAKPPHRFALSTDESSPG
ncbi:putative nucleolar protein 5-1, partial [Zea mays]